MGNKDKIGTSYMEWFDGYRVCPSVWVKKRNILLEATKLLSVAAVIYVTMVVVMAL